MGDVERDCKRDNWIARCMASSSLPMKGWVPPLAAEGFVALVALVAELFVAPVALVALVALAAEAAPAGAFELGSTSLLLAGALARSEARIALCSSSSSLSEVSDALAMLAPEAATAGAVEVGSISPSDSARSEARIAISICSCSSALICKESAQSWGLAALHLSLYI